MCKYTCRFACSTVWPLCREELFLSLFMLWQLLACYSNLWGFYVTSHCLWLYFTFCLVIFVQSYIFFLIRFPYTKLSWFFPFPSRRSKLHYPFLSLLSLSSIHYYAGSDEMITKELKKKRYSLYFSKRLVFLSWNYPSEPVICYWKEKS